MEMTSMSSSEASRCASSTPSTERARWYSTCGDTAAGKRMERTRVR
jgi:hypothetical protein